MNLNKVAKEYIQTAIANINCTRAGWGVGDGKYFEYNEPNGRKFWMSYCIGEFCMEVFADNTLAARIIDSRIYLYDQMESGADLNVSVLAWFKLLEGHLFKN